MRKPAALLATLATVLALAACGDDDNATTTTAQGGGGGGGQGVILDLSSPADNTLAYEQKSLSAKKGPVTINYDNPASLQHDVTVEDEKGEELGATDLVSGDSTSLALELQPGTYTFFCSVPGHREGGMEGELTVK